MRIADPNPGYCSVCFSAQPGSRYLDFEVAFDGAPVLDKETGTIAIDPHTGYQASHDDLYICETCLREACETLALKPELHSRQYREIRRQEARIGILQDMLRRQDAELARLRETILEPPVQSVKPSRKPVAA